MGRSTQFANAGLFCVVMRLLAFSTCVVESVSQKRFEYTCDLSDKAIDTTFEGRYHYGGMEDGLDILAAVYDEMFGWIEEKYPERWAALPEKAKQRSQWRLIEAAKNEKPAAGKGVRRYEYICDLSDETIDTTLEARYHYGGEEDGLDISADVYQEWFGSIPAKYPERWADFPEKAKERSQWRLIEDAEDEKPAARKASRKAAEKKTAEKAVKKDVKRYEYFCDLSDQKIDGEIEGRYHYDDEADGLDISMEAYLRFQHAADVYPGQWEKLPVEARDKEKWHLIEAGQKDSDAAKNAATLATQRFQAWEEARKAAKETEARVAKMRASQKNIVVCYTIDHSEPECSDKYTCKHGDDLKLVPMPKLKEGQQVKAKDCGNHENDEPPVEVKEEL